MPSRKRIAAALSLGVALTGLQLATTPTATAASTGLVISEAYLNGGSSGASYRDKFVELLNPTIAPITFTGSVQYRSATGTANATSSAPVSGVTIPAGGRLLIQGGSNGANGAALPAPDVTAASLNASGTGGTLFLTTSTVLTAPTDPSVVDRIGWGTSNSPEGTAASGSSVVLSYQRTDAPDSDDNAADFTPATPTPTNSRGETVGAVAAADPGDRTVVVGSPIAPIPLTAVGGTAPYSWQAAGLPAGLALEGSTITGTPTVVGTSEVTLTVTDSTATPRTDTETFTITVSGPPETRSIAEIQGTGPASPLAGDTVETQGVVTAMYRTGGFNGMYVQTPGVDATPGASDGLFVFGGPDAANLPAGVEKGDSVAVTGVVSEFNGSTQVTPSSAGVTELASPLPAAQPRAIAYPRTEEGRESHEGELLAPTDRFTVSNVFDLNTFAEIGLATGDEP
ncbi:putative Ig domain-containing protein, partial [uncultured Nocardioides sp.]|uniref:putative Ig domain-containing protein n=1 Tax=uncultured Nocardioides sp. TaxID=198441 RepID=UPI0025CF9311